VHLFTPRGSAIMDGALEGVKILSGGGGAAGGRVIGGDGWAEGASEGFGVGCGDGWGMGVVVGSSEGGTEGFVVGCATTRRMSRPKVKSQIHNHILTKKVLSHPGPSSVKLLTLFGWKKPKD